MDKEDVVHIYNGLLLSHEKNECESVVVRWMNLEPLHRVSQKDKKDYRLLTHIYEI